MSNHQNLTSSVKSIVSGYKHKPSSTARRNRTKEPKRFAYDIVLFAFPGFQLTSESEIPEKNLKKIGSGTIVAYDNENERDVLNSIATLIKSFKGCNDNFDTDEFKIKFSFLKRDGRARKYSKHIPGPGFLYDGKGLKDLRTSKDSKNIYLVNNQVGKNAGVKRKSTSFLDHDLITVNSDDDNFGDDSSLMENISFNVDDSENDLPTRPTKSRKLIDVTDASDTTTCLENIENNSLLKKPFFADNGTDTVMAAVMLLLHLDPFNKALQKCLISKKTAASEIELCLSKILLMLEQPDKIKWKLMLEDICVECEILKDTTIREIVCIILDKINSLKCNIWKTEYFDICHKSKMITEYFSANGTHVSETIDSTLFEFKSWEETLCIKDIINVATGKREVSNVPLEAAHIIENGAQAWKWEFFELTPNTFFMALDNKNQEKPSIYPTRVIPKNTLEDVRSTNPESLNLCSFIVKAGEHYYTAVNGERNKTKEWFLFCGGDRFEFGSYTELWKSVKSYEIVLALYTRNDLIQPLHKSSSEFAESGAFLIERLASRKRALSATNSSVSSRGKSRNDSFTLKDRIDARLQHIYGQEVLKKELTQKVLHAYWEKQRMELNIKYSKADELRSRLHMIFKGNPGTGKTLVAREIAGLLHEMGVISTNKCIEVQRQDLVAEHIGGTATKTKERIEKAMGGVMFVDEAYRLQGESEKDFGKEAADTIMSYMTSSVEGNENPIFIFAGYEKEMDKFENNGNPGLFRRVKIRVKFNDYTPEDLATMTMNVILKRGLRCPHGIEPTLAHTFSLLNTLIRRKNNAALCEDYFEEIIAQQEERLDPDHFNKAILSTLTLDDFKEGSKRFLIKFSGKGNMKDVSTQTQTNSYPEVILNIPNVGLVFGSP